GGPMSRANRGWPERAVRARRQRARTLGADRCPGRREQGRVSEGLMTDSVMISVIMPVRNEAGFIEGAIRSVVAAGEAVRSYEIIVVDGMSDDSTREVVEGLQATLANLVLLDNPKRTVPHAMNLGIKAARGEVVLRLDG